MSRDLAQLSAQIRELQDAQAEQHERPSVEQRMASIHAKLGQRGSAVTTAARGAGRRRELIGHLLTGALGAAAALLLMWWITPEPSLTATSGGEALTAGTWLSSEAQPRAVDFSDGTRLTLAAQSRARVQSLSEHGAQFVLEKGEVRVAVVPREDNHWLIAAGPFEVLVTGTEFDAAWDPRAEALTVRMLHGSVRITGDCLGEARSLRDQQSGRFRCGATETPSGAAAAEPSEPEADGLAAPAPTWVASAAASPRSHPPAPGGSQASGAQAPAPSLSAEPSAAPEDWQALARAGRFKPALAAAEIAGFSSLCTSLGAAQVLELGNVARLAGNPAQASEAYLAARQRFAGSGAAAQAAFQLGRMAFDGSRDYASAQRWFGAYLAEQPGGGLAQEALGRLMESEHRLGSGAAVGHAQQYLKRFPSGPHATLARSISGE